MFDHDHFETREGDSLSCDGVNQVINSTSLASISSSDPFQPILAKELPCRLSIMAIMYGLGRCSALEGACDRSIMGPILELTTASLPASSQPVAILQAWQSRVIILSQNKATGCEGHLLIGHR